MWLARLALGLDRDLTADGLGRFLASCRMFMLAVFGFALIRTGSPVLLTLAAVLVGCESVETRGSRYDLSLCSDLAAVARGRVRIGECKRCGNESPCCVMDVHARHGDADGA